MNKQLTFIVMMLMSVIGISCSARTDVPSAIQNFISTNFPSAQIVKVEREHKGYGVEYEIKLNNGAEIDFDRSYKWEHIDCKKASTNVPKNVIPKTIAKYIAANYPQQQVIEIEHERYGYDVKLSNRIELEFDANGNFLRID